MSEGGGRGYTGGKQLLIDACAKLFLRTIYCANLSLDAGFQYSSWSRRGIGSRAPLIMREYELTTAIVIGLLIQPRTCEMGSSIFSAMS